MLMIHWSQVSGGGHDTRTGECQLSVQCSLLWSPSLRTLVLLTHIHSKYEVITTSQTGVALPQTGVSQKCVCDVTGSCFVDKCLLLN